MSFNVGLSPTVRDGLVLFLDPSSALNYTLSEVEVLVVAGGGGGGANHAGGGGGGGVIYRNSHPVTPGSVISVTVGSGGATAPTNNGPSASNGQNSVFDTLTASGGGGGGNRNDTAGTSPGRDGGSGGGGGGAQAAFAGCYVPGNGIKGQGFPGGRAVDIYGGGGGGAGGKGFDGIGATLLNSGNGGPGLLYTISGFPKYYAGGGGGGYGGNVGNGKGGIGGGGNGGILTGDSGTAGEPNTGGGGGGGGAGGTVGSSGGSGVVIVRYPGPQKATGGTITQVGGFTIHTFNSSGTFTPLTQTQLRTTFYGLQDLSGNNNTETQSGGVVYNSGNGGILNFDGVNDFLTCTPTPTLLQGNPNLTVMGFYRRTGNFSSKGFWGVGGSNAGGIGQGICNWNSSNTNEITIDSWSQSTFTTGQTYPLNTWIGVAWRKIAGPMTRSNCTISIFNGSTLTHYTSTSLTVLRPEASSNLVINSIGGLTVGSISVDTTYCSPIDVGSHLIYNRLLTDVEIQQNFNALRGRFGV